MMWFVGIFVSLVVVGSELLPASQMDYGWPSLLGIALATIFVPLFASIQSVVTAKRWSAVGRTNRYRQPALRCVYWSCLGIWASCALAIVTVFGWPTIVRQHWRLDGFILVDELIVALPMVASIVVAWMFLYGAEQELTQGDAKRTDWRDWIRQAGDVAWGRLRVLAGLVWLPVAVVFVSRDIVNLIVPDGTSGVWTSAVFLADLIVLVCFYPVLISKTWKTSDVEDADLRDRFDRVSLDFRLAPIRARVWDTNHQMANAVVVGMVPKTRTVFLSDLLVNHFEPREIEAVYRHELAHLRCGHLALRLFYLLLPIGLGLLIESRTQFISGLSTADSHYAQWASWIAVAGFLLGYYGVFFNWLIRSAEIEADLVSCQDTHRAFSLAHAENYRRALLKMAAWSPELYARSTLAHPSIKTRLNWLSRCSNCPPVVHQFRRRFFLVQTCVIVGVAISGVVVCLVA